MVVKRSRADRNGFTLKQLCGNAVEPARNAEAQLGSLGAIEALRGRIEMQRGLDIRANDSKHGTGACGRTLQADRASSRPNGSSLVRQTT